jgi:DNA-binding PadR family transcriptional regulator
MPIQGSEPQAPLRRDYADAYIDWDFSPIDRRERVYKYEVARTHAVTTDREFMSLRFALLGLLARESLTGYDLTKRFDSTVGFFWSAKHSQIYPELASLTQESLVTFELVTQTSKPNKKVYTITEEGRAALSAWMGAQSEKRNVKDPLLMRMWIVGMVDPELALRQLADAKLESARRAALLHEAEAQALAQRADRAETDNSLLGSHLALRCGVMQQEAYDAWMLWAMEQLERLIANSRAVTQDA